MIGSLIFFRMKDDWLAAVSGIKKHLVRESEPNKLTYFGELLGGHSFSPKMVSQHSIQIQSLISNQHAQ